MLFLFFLEFSEIVFNVVSDLHPTKIINNTVLQQHVLYLASLILNFSTQYVCVFLHK